MARIAAEHSLSPQLIHSVIKVESNYNPHAISNKGALGLMQLIPATARRFGVTDVFNPVQNIQGGAKYLRYLLDLYHNNFPLALAAYNAGEAAVARYGGVPPFAETRNYLILVGRRLAEAKKAEAANAAAAPAAVAGRRIQGSRSRSRRGNRPGGRYRAIRLEIADAMKPLAALAISATMLFAQSDRASLHSVTAVRHWSLDDVTRLAIEVSGDFNFRTDRLHNPERVYFDILKARPRIDAKRIWSGDINDKLVQRVRVAETNPGTTRVVVDLAGPVEISTSQLSSPHRLIIEVRAGRGPVIPSGPALPEIKPPPAIRAEVPKTEVPAGIKPASAVQPPPLVLKAEAPVLKAEPAPCTGQTAECACGEGQSGATG